MEIIIIAALAAVLLVIWVVSTKRNLAVMDENSNNAMSQIGVQLSSRFDAMTALLDLTCGYAAHESQTLLDAVYARRGVITAKSTPDEVVRQEEVIRRTLGRVAAIAEQYPALKNSESYGKCMDAVDGYGKMVRTSRLIYNDSVAKLNRAIRVIPTRLIAGLLGFRQRAYLETEEDKHTVPRMGQ